MKKVCCSLLFIFVSFQFLQAQPDAKIDSLCSRICESLISNKDQVDSVRTMEAFTSILPPFIIQNNLKTQVDSILKIIFFRLQRNCTEYSAILDRENPPKGDWKEVEERPDMKLTKKNCTEFLNFKKYTYLEHSGDTVHLEIDNGYWIDHFKDGTWSKLRFIRTNDCEIEIEFIESNNTIRKNFSKRGDKYRYQIFDRGENYYELLVEAVGVEELHTFKMYVEPKRK